MLCIIFLGDMAVKIRLARHGAKKRPYYKIVVADAKSPRDGKFLDVLGSYNPLLKDTDPSRITMNIESAKNWVSKGAQPTSVVLKIMNRVQKS